MVALSVMYKFWKTDGTRFVIVDADHFVAFCGGYKVDSIAGKVMLRIQSQFVASRKPRS